ncbi:MAG: DUF4340 domain-containing protein [Clostridia bacterium]|nr:DUF4340 domain-containing protein [Clostridia bacterium]
MSENTNLQRRKKKNKALPLIILVGIMCVLGIAYASLSAANDKAEADRLAAEEAANAAIMLAELDSTTATGLSYRVGEGEWITFTRSGTEWQYTEDTEFPLNQETVSTMAAAISSIGATRKVEEGTEADYGLDTPSYEIHITYNGSTTYRYAVGDMNTFNGEYYFRNDDGGVYMISSALLPYFQYTLEDLIVLDTPVTDISSEYITGITVTAADGTANTVTDADGIAGLYSLFTSLDCEEWADYSADSEEMSGKYGIDQVSSITVSYKKSVDVTDTSGNVQTTMMDATAKVYFGNAVLDGSGVYYTLPKSTVVYTIGSDVYEGIMGYLSYTPAE